MNRTDRVWGHYDILYEKDNTKVKELYVWPHKQLSMQRHQARSEYWHVVSGRCIVWTLEDGKRVSWQLLDRHENLFVPINKWHQLENPFETPCRLIEIQYGFKCVEQDIERLPI
jgi:mannose-6-phosphate isomerase-like protein (cupin superfamily)